MNVEADMYMLCGFGLGGFIAAIYAFAFALGVV